MTIGSRKAVSIHHVPAGVDTTLVSSLIEEWPKPGVFAIVRSSHPTSELLDESRRLLAAYSECQTELGSPRIEELEGIEPGRMTKLHGQLLALGLIECEVANRQTGLRYKVTSEGHRTLLHAECAD